MSLRRLSKAAYVSSSHISEMERGIKTPGARTAESLDKALHAGGELAALVREPDSVPTHPEAAEAASGPVAWWEADSAVELIGKLSREDVALDRRRAAQAIGGFVFGAALLEPMDRWLSGLAQDRIPTRRMKPRLGEAEMAALENAAIVFREWDDQFGGGLRRRAVVGQLSEVAELVHESHGRTVNQRLYRVMAQLAQTVGTMSWDSGEAAAAQRYYLLALRAARHGGDFALSANVLASVARQLLYMDRPHDAMELVRLAQDTAAGKATAKVRAMLHTREAWAYAKQGRVTAFRRSTDRAHEALAENDREEEPSWIGYFGDAELAGVTGGRLLELAHGQPQMAAEAAGWIEQAVLLRGPGHLRSRSLDKVGIAEARLLEGEVDEAARLGHDALDSAEQTTSDRVRVKLAEFYQTTRDHRRVTAVAELRDRMRPLLAA
jgi:transcriptional regulator with XRE-family HTH domain